MMHFYRACVLALLVATSPPAQCFLPAASGIGHGKITRDGIAPIAETIQSSQRRFTEAAIAEIVIANIEEDKIQSPERHFDGDKFRVSSGRLVVLKEEILKTLGEGDGSDARELLGQALHPLQDYYSHTSHIDAGGPFSTIVNPSLGVETFGHTPDPNGTCSNFFVFGGPSTSAQTSGYYAIDGIFPLPGQTYSACSAPDNKCSHGNSLAAGPLFPCGLNKDSEARPNHVLAVQLATASTTEYVLQVLNLIRFRLPAAEADIAVCRLMGIPNPEVTCMPPIPCESNAVCGGGICAAGTCLLPRPGSSCSVQGTNVQGCNVGEVCTGSGVCITGDQNRFFQGIFCPGFGENSLSCTPSPNGFVFREPCGSVTQAELIQACISVHGCVNWAYSLGGIGRCQSRRLIEMTNFIVR